MLEPAADHGVEDRVLAMRDRDDLHHLAVGARAVGLREFAERPFRLAHARKEASFDHDLGFGRHADVAGQALHHRQRPALQRARDLKLVVIDRHDRLRGQQGQRIDADHDRGLERLTGLLGHAVERKGVARQHQHAETVGAGELAAMDRDVLLSGLWVAHDHDAGRDIGAAVVLVVGRQRQDFGEIELTVSVPVHHLLRRRGCHLLPRNRMERRVLETLQHLGELDAHRLGDPAPVRHDSGNHRDGVAIRPREQRGALTVEPLGVGCDLEFQPDVWLDNCKAVARAKMVQPFAQGSAPAAADYPHERL